MRAIDCGELEKRISSLARLARSDAQKSLLGRVLYIVENMPTLTQPNEWVGVDDRLPEVGQEVLVYWRNTSQKAEHFELTHYDGDHWFLLDNTERPWIVVVAWMPLPAPPDRRPPEEEA